MTSEPFDREKELEKQVSISKNMQVEPTIVSSVSSEESRVIPLVGETLSVNKQWVQAGTVVIRKGVEAFTQNVPVDLAREEVHVDRVTVNRVLAENESAEPRQEGDTLVIPIIEEELVVVKRRVIREEVRVTKQVVAQHQEISDTVRREQIHIESSGDLQATGDTGPR